MSIFFLVRSLEVGGAERQLVQLATGLHERQQNVRVGVFYRRGPLVADLEGAGVEIVDLKKSGRWDIVAFLIRTLRALRRNQPDIVYSMLGGANIVAAAIRPFVPMSKLVWSIRSSNMKLNEYDWLHAASYRVERAISRIPDLIIANSAAGKDFAVVNGFPPENIHIVPNGIDTERFRPNNELRTEQRRLWNLKDHQIAVGVLARLDPMKDQQTFLRAAVIAAGRNPKLCFLCIGEGPDRRHLQSLAETIGIAGKVKFTGRADPAAALNALDIVCSSSAFGEGFSNSIAEAMSCGRPCIVTDVGDSAMIVGNCGDVVRPCDPQTLAASILSTAERIESIDPSKPRSRVVENFSSDAMVDRTLNLLGKVISARQ
jgi:glycosyltransferase involved in cell wall biosynthesis